MNDSLQTEAAEARCISLCIALEYIVRDMDSMHDNPLVRTWQDCLRRLIEDFSVKEGK